jgi:hypothetical protein
MKARASAPTPSRLARLSRLAILAAIGADLALGVVYAALFTVLVATGRSKGADFTAFYTGWRIVLEGHGGQLYDPAVQLEFQRQILEGQTFTAGLNAFINPPHMVLPYTPLGLLPLDASFLVWTAIQIGLLVVAATLLVGGVAAGWTRIEKVSLVAILVAFSPWSATETAGPALRSGSPLSSPRACSPSGSPPSSGGARRR